MSDTRTLLEYKDLQVDVETTPNEELKAHLHSTILGTPGGFRYTHGSLDERLHAPGENYFMYLRKQGRMLGSVGFVGRHCDTAGIRHDSWLIRYFSIKAPMRSVPEQERAQKSGREEERRTTILARFIGPIFDEPSQLRAGDKTQGPAVIYALIEERNLRSLNFSLQMGMECVSKVAGFPFSRLWPRLSHRVERLPGEEQDMMMALIREYYSDHVLFVPDPLFRNGQYFVIREGGRVVAGLQFYPVTWKIVDFGGPLANRLMGLLGKTGFVRRRVDPKGVRLLAFDGIYCAAGKEDALYELMEGVLAREKAYMALLEMDRVSPLYTLFRKKKRRGILYSIFGTFHARVMAHFVRMPDAVKEEMRRKPFYVPSYDNS